VLACAALGFVLAAAHPDITAGDRLYMLSWLAVAIGIPTGIDRFRAGTSIRRATAVVTQRISSHAAGRSQ
jgi:hypothetical protein